MGVERIHLRQRKGDRSLLNPPKRSHGLGNRGETICKEAVGVGYFKRGKMRRYGKGWNFPFFGTSAWLYEAHWLAKAYGHLEVGHLMGLFV